MTGDLRELYEEVILEHNRHPRHFPENPPGSNHHAHGFNPLCDLSLIHISEPTRPY